MDASYQIEAARVVGERITELKRLTFEQAASLPEAVGEETVLGKTRCAVTVFRQRNPYALPNSVLVTVQVARWGLLGMVSYHTERGLVFSPESPVREATDLELQNSGG